MVMEEEDLGLSLSLSFSHSKTAAAAKVPDNRLKIHHTNPSSLIMPLSFISNSPAGEKTLPCSDGGRTASLVKAGIDVNCAPGEREAEDGGVCSPNSTISSSSGKRSSEAEVDGDRAWSRGTSDEDEDGGADNSNSRNNSSKKLRLSKDQAAVLEETFKDQNTLNPKQKMGLAKRLGLRPRQVEVWFQNRRARTKLKQTEVDCEYLKRCYETLTKENRRLHKEVQQLRALKLSPQLYMHMPPTTLTMCPSCEQRKIAPVAARPWGPTPVLQNRAFEGLRSGS